jgi:hypothetical protein
MTEPVLPLFIYMKKLLIFIFIVILLMFFSIQNSSSIPWKTDEPNFTDVTVTSSSNHLLFFATLNNSFTEEMVEGLHSGIPIHFSFFIELAPTEEGWRSEQLVALKTNHIIHYNTLKETYTVEVEESGKRFYTYDSLDKAQQGANELNGVKVVELSKLKPEIPYSIRIRAELYKKTLPMGLHEFIPFISWWDVKTEWYTIAFTI